MAGLSSQSFLEVLFGATRAEGFDAFGAVDVGRVSPELWSQHVSRYDQWLAQGLHGQMEYLARGRDRRNDIKQVFAPVKSVLSVALAYSRLQPEQTLKEHGPKYARYLQGADYHLELPKKLEQVMSRVKLEFPDLQYKICVDTSAVLERSWAALAGLGWIGKNTLLIHPKHGSYLFLGEVLMNFETGLAPKPLSNLCGHCSRCLDACPSQAFTQPGVLDSRKCISYQTLERKSFETLPSHGWIAGCDVCQEVCPFNIKAVTQEALLGPKAADPRLLVRWDELLEEEEAQYQERVKNSALSRVKPDRFRRNLSQILLDQLKKMSLQERSQVALEIKDLVLKKQMREIQKEVASNWERILSLLDAED